MVDSIQQGPVRGSGGRTVKMLAWVAAVAAIALPIIFLLGGDLRPEPEIAGRYSVSAGRQCVGGAFDLRQSGQFVSINRPGGESIARLRARRGRVSGDVQCSGGRTVRLRALARGGHLRGSLGAARLRAERTSEFDLTAGREPVNPASVDGDYVLAPESVCLGRHISLEGGDRPFLSAGDLRSMPLNYRQGELSGPVRCLDGDRAKLTGIAAGERLELEIRRKSAAGPGEQRIEQAVADIQRTLGEQTAAFFLALVVVLIAARLFGAIAQRIGQARVMGEIVAGILLGPTLFGALMPDLQAELFSAVLPTLGIIANLGLIIYVFIIGMELDAEAVRGRGGGVVVVALSGFLVPLVLGSASGLLIYEALAPDIDFIPFALFLGLTLSITAFPVLARILEERGMLGGTVGTTALAAAAIDDLFAWLLITLATALAVAGSVGDVLPTLGWTVAFAVVMFGVIRPLLRRAAAAYDGSRSPGWIAVVFSGILLSAFATEEIGIALIIGAVAMGAVMPKEAALTKDLRRGSEAFVSMLLLPLFFAYTGLRTDVGALGEPELWEYAALLLGLAIVGKLGAVALAARASGMHWRVSWMLGALMNTRGLTELIVLNLALEIGVISEALFTALVLMALITTFMTGPLLRLLDPSGALGRRTVPAPAPPTPPVAPAAEATASI